MYARGAQNRLDENMEEMRLNKYLASCGVCSRRDADKYIEDGRVKVNGQLPEKGLKVTDEDKVEVDGKSVGLVKESTVLAYNKPVGVVCTERDSHAERTVIDEISFDKRITYAGRLDKDSNGLLIMTDDGNLINAMMKGQNRHEKEYVVVVDKEINGGFLKRMQNGVYLSELDVTTRGCKIKKLAKNSFNIILTQGLNRQIRRMCSELGFEVVSLKRVRVMNIQLGDIREGEYREIKGNEKRELYKLAGIPLKKNS